jgi:hypothetical protein
MFPSHQAHDRTAVFSRQAPNLFYLPQIGHPPVTVVRSLYFSLLS